MKSWEQNASKILSTEKTERSLANWLALTCSWLTSVLAFYLSCQFFQVELFVFDENTAVYFWAKLTMSNLWSRQRHKLELVGHTFVLFNQIKHFAAFYNISWKATVCRHTCKVYFFFFLFKCMVLIEQSPPFIST